MNKAPGIYPRALLSTIVHDYFLNRGVPGSADMIPSACEPVLFTHYIISTHTSLVMCDFAKYYLPTYILCGFSTFVNRHEKFAILRKHNQQICDYTTLDCG